MATEVAGRSSGGVRREGIHRLISVTFRTFFLRHGPNPFSKETLAVRAELSGRGACHNLCGIAETRPKRVTGGTTRTASPDKRFDCCSHQRKCSTLGTAGSYPSLPPTSPHKIRIMHTGISLSRSSTTPTSHPSSSPFQYHATTTTTAHTAGLFPKTPRRPTLHSREQTGPGNFLFHPGFNVRSPAHEP